MTPPPADIHVDLELARRLLADQFPDLAQLPMRRAAEGWDNTIFRVGEDLAVRIPRRELGAKLIAHEQRWLPELAPHLPVRIPAPTGMGRPTDYFDYPWSVVPWVTGTMALHSPPHPSEAARLGEFLGALHGIAVPPDPPINVYRGGPLAERRELLGKRLQGAVRAMSLELAEATRTLLDDSLAAAPSNQPTWIHGDLHSRNVITVEGQIVSIIDWGDICTGDRATDLASLWILLPPEAHDLFWTAYGTVDDGLMIRARAWAVSFGLMLYESHHEADRAFAEAGLETIQRAVRSS